MIEQLLSRIASSLGGYLGLFAVSVLGNLVPFVPIPYLLVVFTYAAFLSYNPVIVGVVSGVGGGVGKLIVYLMGRGTSSLVTRYAGGEERLEAFKQLIGRYGALAAFIFAATPSPDDVVMIVLGLVRYDVARFFVATTLGKIVISVATASTGWLLSEVLMPIGVVGCVAVSLAFLAAATAIIYAIDWVKILEITSREGWRGVVGLVRSEGWGSILVSRLARREGRAPKGAGGG